MDVDRIKKRGKKESKRERKGKRTEEGEEQGQATALVCSRRVFVPGVRVENTVFFVCKENEPK